MPQTPTPTKTASPTAYASTKTIATEAMRLAAQRQPKSGDNGIRAMSRAGASAGIVMSVCCTLGGRPIRDTGEIGRARLRVQFSQQSVIARVLLLFSYKAGGIVDVTENDCAGRA